jgi:hypothetical protein
VVVTDCRDCCGSCEVVILNWVTDAMLGSFHLGWFG